MIMLFPSRLFDEVSYYLEVNNMNRKYLGLSKGYISRRLSFSSVDTTVSHFGLDDIIIVRLADGRRR